MYSLKFLLFVIFFLILSITNLNFINATLSPKSGPNKNTKKAKELKLKSGPLSSNVFQRNLVDDEPTANSIIIENAAYYEKTGEKLFNGTILGYVTPWNNHGYDVAKIWAKKFNYISPVWLQILRKGSKLYELGGSHDIDSGWTKDVQKSSAGGHTKIVPRILFDKFSDNDFSQLLTYKEERDIVAKIIYQTCQKYKFDGIVLEVWSQLSARVDDEHLIALVTEIADKLRAGNFDCILVVPPTREHTYDLFSRKHFERLNPHITAFSLMTYDFSSIQRPGANAPLYWVENAVKHICPDSVVDVATKRSKILLGLNMYGSDFTPNGGGPIIAHEYLSYLKHLKGRLQFDERDVENFFEVKTSSGRHMVFFPTLYSINERLKLAHKLGTGLSLWELGQGLDYFYDLF
uniref:Chitinase domain-containing protein 1 n=1 Tax=Corethrella appendiculata TaxID=1370023 RepID=U5ENT6_9DIPT